MGLEQNLKEEQIDARLLKRKARIAAGHIPKTEKNMERRHKEMGSWMVHVRTLYSRKQITREEYADLMESLMEMFG